MNGHYLGFFSDPHGTPSVTYYDAKLVRAGMLCGLDSKLCKKKAKIAHFLDKSSKLGSFKQAKTRYVLQVAPHGIPFTFKSWTTSPIKSCLTDTSWTLTTPASKIQSTGPAESNLPTSLSTTNSECFFFDVLFLGIQRQRSVNSLVLECVPTFEFQVYYIFFVVVRRSHVWNTPKSKWQPGKRSTGT